MILVGCNRSGVMWSSMDRSGCDRFGWIGLRWGVIGLGGSVFGGDAISVVVQDIWRCRCWGAIGWIDNSLFFLSLYLSLCTSDLEMVCSENRNVKPYPGQSLILHGQLKWFYGKFYFSCATKHALRCKTISWNGFTPKQMEPKLLGLRLDIVYFIKNWKYCNKTIFKCMNSIVGPIFNIFFS